MDYTDIELPKPWPTPVDGQELFEGVRAILRRYTTLNEHQVVIAVLYIVATWVDLPEMDVSLIKIDHPEISENPVVQKLVHPSYKLGRS
jgi:hypothetical protein